jgi:hypothetical protein
MLKSKSKSLSLNKLLMGQGKFRLIKNLLRG